MPADRFLTAQFCDDIRHERGGKFSLIGCYRDEMLVPTLPYVAPRFCAQVLVSTPLDQPFEHLKISLQANGEILAEIEYSQEELEEHQQRVGAIADAERITFVALMGVSPMIINEEAVVAAVAETEAGELRGGQLRARLRRDTDAPF